MSWREAKTSLPLVPKWWQTPEFSPPICPPVQQELLQVQMEESSPASLQRLPGSLPNSSERPWGLTCVHRTRVELEEQRPFMVPSGLTLLPAKGWSPSSQSEIQATGRNSWGLCLLPTPKGTAMSSLAWPLSCLGFSELCLLHLAMERWYCLGPHSTDDVQGTCLQPEWPSNSKSWLSATPAPWSTQITSRKWTLVFLPSEPSIGRASPSWQETGPGLVHMTPSSNQAPRRWFWGHHPSRHTGRLFLK